ncbi:MAG: oligosaccharide flippase family protein, partial [Alphaproteobacteria bacterium]
RENKHLILAGFGANVCWIVLQKVDVLMLGMFRPLAETGHYTVALTLIDAMVMLPGAIAAVLMPRLARELHVQERTQLLLVTLAAVMAVFGVTCVGMALVGPWLVPMLFGSEFEATVPVFQRLLVAAWLMGGYAVCQQAVQGYGRVRYQFVAPLTGLVVKAGLGWMLISHGMMAAANATIAGYAVALGVALGLALWGHVPATRANGVDTLA